MTTARRAAAAAGVRTFISVGDDGTASASPQPTSPRTISPAGVGAFTTNPLLQGVRPAFSAGFGTGAAMAIPNHCSPAALPLPQYLLAMPQVRV